MYGDAFETGVRCVKWRKRMLKGNANRTWIFRATDIGLCRRLAARLASLSRTKPIFEQAFFWW